MDAVTQVLIDRSRDAEKITRMVLVSLVAHLALHFSQPSHVDVARRDFSAEPPGSCRRRHSPQSDREPRPGRP